MIFLHAYSTPDHWASILHIPKFAHPKIIFLFKKGSQSSVTIHPQILSPSRRNCSQTPPSLPLQLSNPAPLPATPLMNPQIKH